MPRTLLWSLEVVPVAAWDALIPELLAGKGDLIAGRFTVTESRRKLIAFTSEVFPTRNVVLTRRPHRVVETLAELRQEKVGTVKGIENLRRTPTWSRLVVKYFGETAPDVLKKARAEAVP